MRHQLTLLRGGRKVAEYRIDLPDVIVGRGRSAHIRLDDNSMVSRQHAVVRRRGEGHVVEDLGGANGTWVNGAQVDVHILRPGDHIVLGDDTLRYDFAVAGAQSLRALSTPPAADQTGVTGDELEAIPELGEENLGSAEELADLREHRREAAPPPMMPGGLEGSGERTAVASKDQLERLLAELTLKQGPHVILKGSQPIEIVPLGEGPVRIGHTDDCAIRLPGTRWFFGKVAATLVKQTGGWCVVPESPFWNPVSLNKHPLSKIRQLEEGDVLVFKTAAWTFSRGEQR